MTKELLQKAKELDSEINYLGYWLRQAELIPEVTNLKIVEREPNGSEHTLAEIEKDDPIRGIIALHLKGKYEANIKHLEDEFNNL